MTYKSQTVSAIVITENNEATLERALSSLKWVDELIVFDRGSTDATLAIARGFTDRVFFHPSANLTLLRRDAFSMAKCDWLLWVEPDEWIEEMLRHEIDGVLLNTPAHLNGYRIPRVLKFQNQWVSRVVGDESSHVLRLARKKQWDVSDAWDAALTVNGDVGQMDRPLGYAPYPTVEALFAGMNVQSTASAYRHLETLGIRPGDRGTWALLWNTKRCMIREALFKGGLFQGVFGLTLSMANATAVFLKFAKVGALTQNHK